MHSRVCISPFPPEELEENVTCRRMPWQATPRQTADGRRFGLSPVCVRDGRRVQRAAGVDQRRGLNSLREGWQAGAACGRSVDQRRGSPVCGRDGRRVQRAVGVWIRGGVSPVCRRDGRRVQRAVGVDQRGVSPVCGRDGRRVQHAVGVWIRWGRSSSPPTHAP
eukprot:356927-Chlamydomonas_euryale.AAC.2